MTQHRPRKRFGQHFLHDTHVLDRLFKAIMPKRTEHLVEIGPGLGALTCPLLEAAGELDVIEIDHDVIQELEARCADKGTLRVHLQDVLKTSFRGLAGNGQPLRVVGNLPYNISTPLIFHLIEQIDCIQDMHFMVQKEVADRMAARAASADYGRLSVMVQHRCLVELLFQVEPGAFRPPPKVRSALVRLTPYSEPPIRVADDKLLALVVTKAFGQRRKTLRNSLKGLLSRDAIEAAGLDPHQRPETVDLAGYAALANALGQH